MASSNKHDRRLGYETPQSSTGTKINDINELWKWGWDKEPRMLIRISFLDYEDIHIYKNGDEFHRNSLDMWAVAKKLW